MNESASDGFEGSAADEAPDQDSPPDRVDLNVDEEKLEKWEEVKSDYEINPDGKPMPNVWDAGGDGDDGSLDRPEADAEHRRRVNNEDAPEVFARETDSESTADDRPTEP